MTSDTPTGAGENRRIVFLTGRLAAPALCSVVEPLGERLGFEPVVVTLKIQVAALMTVRWVTHQLTKPEFAEQLIDADEVLLPGHCEGDTSALAERFGCPFTVGPKDLFDLPHHFGAGSRAAPDFSAYTIDILAEINHAPKLPLSEVHRIADHYRESGADIIDLGAIPDERWDSVADVVRSLRADGHRLSIDSFDHATVTDAVDAGAELVLSCNSTNVNWASELDAELVVIPDDIRDVMSMTPTIERLREAGRTFRIDPILEPIGFGFAASLARYFEARRIWPELPMMMGVGNLTELTEVDSAGINVLLAAICEELGVGSVLATEVINWSRSSVAEFDFARRLVHHAVTKGVLPKHLDSRLVMLRDPKLRNLSDESLGELADGVRDRNFRIFAEGGRLHLMNGDGYWTGTDAFELFDRMTETVTDLDASHAFYLGYELQKAVTALTLGKQYTQDQALRWGMLTIEEVSAHDRRKRERGAE